MPSPYGFNFSYSVEGEAQKFWGHAVSPDMVHWQELPEAIYPFTYGDWVWSGSAVIDSANTGGFQTGTNAVIVAPFYSTARGQCIDYSTDGGLTFTNYAGNPVVNVAGRDPHMLWYAPSNYWVMAVYDSNLGGIDFFSTPDFHQWTYRSGIAGFYECPDLFELPVDGDTNNMMWELNDGSAGYMLGQFNGAVFTPSTAKLPGNSGSGFYASQTFTAMPTGDSASRPDWLGTSIHAGHAVQPDDVLSDGAYLANLASRYSVVFCTDSRNHQCGAKFLFMDELDAESGVQPSFRSEWPAL